MKLTSKTLTRRTLLKSTVVLAGCGSALKPIPGTPVDTTSSNANPTGASGSTGPTPPVTDEPKNPPEPTDPTNPNAAAAPVDLPESLTLFPLAVMSGELMPDSALVWTRYTGNKALVLWVWKDVSQGESNAVANDDEGFVHVDVSELEAATQYFYMFVEQDGEAATARSTVGKFKTAPSLQSRAAVTFGAASCTHQRRLPFPVMARAGQTPLDFFIHGGDHVYTDGAESEQDYLDLYAETWASSGLRALHSNHGLLVTWDDHEFENNFDPEKTSSDRMRWATDSFFRHSPVKRLEAAPNRLWRSFRFGEAVEVFVLDSRTERLPSTRNGSNPIYISPEQMSWLKQGLSQSQATFKFVVNSVPIAKFGGLFAAAAADRWEGYGKQRLELLDHIVDNGLKNVWFISGDFHLGAVSKVEPSGKYSGLYEVLAGPGGNWQNPVWWSLQGSSSLEYLTPDTNFTIFSADPVKGTLKVTFVDEDGSVMFEKTYTAAA